MNVKHKIALGVAAWVLLAAFAGGAKAVEQLRMMALLDCGTLDGKGRVIVIVNDVKFNPFVIECKRQDA